MSAKPALHPDQGNLFSKPEETTIYVPEEDLPPRITKIIGTTVDGFLILGCVEKKKVREGPQDSYPNGRPRVYYTVEIECPFPTCRLKDKRKIDNILYKSTPLTCKDNWKHYVDFDAGTQQCRDVIQNKFHEKGAISPGCGKWLPFSSFHDRGVVVGSGKRIQCGECMDKNLPLADRLMKAIHSSASDKQRRGKKVTVDRNDIQEILEEQNYMCHYGSLLGKNIPLDTAYNYANKHGLAASVDRIDSDGHYSRGNIVICCRAYNWCKNSTPYQEFIELILPTICIGDPNAVQL